MFQMQMVAKECALERSGWLLSCEDSQNGRPRSIQELSAWKSPPWGCLLRSPRCICKFLAKCVGKIFPWDKLQPVDIARILWCSRAFKGSCARIRLKATIFALKSVFLQQNSQTYLLSGLSAASKENISYILGNEKCKGQAVIIVVGGAREILCVGTGQTKLVLKNRKGFCKQAIVNG